MNELRYSVRLRGGVISSTAKYAVRALQALATHDRDEYMRLDGLAKKSKVPAPYLAKIMKKLAANEIIDSRRGPNGGFRYKWDAEPLTLYTIAACLEDPIVTDSCFLHDSACSKTKTCSFHQQWSGVRRQILSFLSSTKVLGFPVGRDLPR